MPDKFPPVPEHSLFVQILNIGGCYWLTTTNIDTNIKYASSGANTVRIYDSGMSSHSPHSLTSVNSGSHLLTESVST